MVAKDEDLGIDMIRFPQRDAFYTFRFGGGHDGEHWLTKTVGAEVRATGRIKGIVLTYYAQDSAFTIWNVMILLDNTKIVLLLKDLTNLGPTIKKSLLTGTGTGKIQIVDKYNNPLSKVTLAPGDLIGKTTDWQQGKYGTFHFALLKYEKIQDYRRQTPSGGTIANDEDVERLKSMNTVPVPRSWFINVLTQESPIRCFK